MTATQTRIRRGTNSEVASVTPASSEIVHNTTDKRLHLGDGSTAGGIILPKMADIQTSAPFYAAAGGSANALTVTLSPVPPALIAGLWVRTLATYTNTGAATLSVNGGTAKNIYRSANGTLGGLVGGEILAGGLYDLVYDGTQFQLLGATPQSSTPTGLELLQIATASNSSSLTFTGLTSAFENYQFVITHLRNSAAATLIMRINGSSSSSYKRTYITIDSTGVTNASGTAETGMVVSNIDDSLSGANGVVNLSAVSGRNPTIAAQCTYGETSAVPKLKIAGGLYTGTGQVTSVTFIPTTGTLYNGNIKLFGLKSSL